MLGLALVAAGAAAAGGGIAPESPASPNAERIRDTYWLILGLTGGIFLIVEGALLVFIVRFRNRGRPRDVEGPQIVGHTRLETIWTVVPVLILVAIASFVFYKLPGIQDVPPASAAGGRLEIKVEGHQYYWRFVYPNGAVAVDTLRVPVNRNVRLTLTSPDVIHSWWVPELGGKMDAIPGETNHWWFRAERIGRFRVKCAEFCGIQHARMNGWVEAIPPEAFEAWVRERRTAAAGLGEETYVGVCAKCHGLTGRGGIGPPLAGSGSVADRRQLERIIREGVRGMPAVGKTWDERQVDAVVAYVRRQFARGGRSGS